MQPETHLQPGQPVTSRRHGTGRVEFDKGPTVIVRFEHGIEECEKSAVDVVASVEGATAGEVWHEPLWVVAHVQAEAIRSVNDTWGVFSRSRIALLPHQLWVCRRVLDAWPTRWLVADDVGLGKTIEAGLILWPLLSRGTVRRLLILCPASLVEQWQYRLRTMFDIRVAVYTAGADTDRTDFWGTQPYVVASLETLRGDSAGRHRRMLDADPWDLMIVDEAHRLNADEQGPTLGYKLVQQLQDARKLGSMVFFTGTPHRGKNYNFLALLKLLRPDAFDPRRSLREHLPLLRDVMIRNNKQDVTDLRGAKLFQPPKVESATYAYSPAEQAFYTTLTLFIATGQAYASKLSETDGRAVMLVLTAMQKLASSSVAAIRRALRGRLERIREDRRRLDALKARRAAAAAAFARDYEAAEDAGDLDALSTMDEQIVALDAKLRLMEDEEPRLQELVAAADAVGAETKIEKILEEVTGGRFAGRPVLFFTEYKATQSLLMSKLIQRFGDGCVTFINGDERADDVTGRDGHARPLFEKRETAADRFNGGDVRFLVSTEAGGEGIDLQERCHSLIHVDLPWNPMRLHQRVGRLNRYGQTRRVEVLTLRNPETVESRIWDQLNQKLQQIQQAFTGVMDEPEDIMQLVLGMTSPTLFRELFAGAAGVRPESVNGWFDQKTARLGGRDVVEAVKDLVGNCARFDFQQASAHLPKLDLPALKPFFTAMLTLNRRKFRDGGNGLAFLTPEAWMTEPGIRDEYDGMVFDRQARGRDAAQRVLGVGHKLVDAAVRQASSATQCAASVPSDLLDEPLHVFRVRDRLTDRPGNVRVVIAAVLGRSGSARLLKDWELLEVLNRVPVGRTKLVEPCSRPAKPEEIRSSLDAAADFLRRELPGLGLSFKYPEVEPLALLWPDAAT